MCFYSKIDLLYVTLDMVYRNVRLLLDTSVLRHKLYVSQLWTLPYYIIMLMETSCRKASQSSLPSLHSSYSTMKRSDTGTSEENRSNIHLNIYSFLLCLFSNLQYPITGYQRAAMLCKTASITCIK